MTLDSGKLRRAFVTFLKLLIIKKIDELIQISATAVISFSRYDGKKVMKRNHKVLTFIVVSVTGTIKYLLFWFFLQLGQQIPAKLKRSASSLLEKKKLTAYFLAAALTANACDTNG